MKRAIYPGSFDPVTYGHLDIIQRAAKQFGHLDVVIMNNQDKHYLFSEEQRIKMLKETTKDLKNVSIYADSGLTVDFAHKRKADIIIRGLRATMDFEYELQQSTINMTLANDVETIFFMAKPQYSFLSSSSAKVVAMHGGDLKPFVPELVAKQLKLIYQKEAK